MGDGEAESNAFKAYIDKLEETKPQLLHDFPEETPEAEPDLFKAFIDKLDEEKKLKIKLFLSGLNNELELNVELTRPPSRTVELQEMLKMSAHIQECMDSPMVFYELVDVYIDIKDRIFQLIRLAAESPGIVATFESEEGPVHFFVLVGPYDSANKMFKCRLKGLDKTILVHPKNLCIAGDIPGELPTDEPTEVKILAMLQEVVEQAQTPITTDELRGMLAIYVRLYEIKSTNQIVTGLRNAMMDELFQFILLAVKSPGIVVKSVDGKILPVLFVFYDSANKMFDCMLKESPEWIDVHPKNLCIAGDIPGELPTDEPTEVKILAMLQEVVEQAQTPSTTDELRGMLAILVRLYEINSTNQIVTGLRNAMMGELFQFIRLAAENPGIVATFESKKDGYLFVLVGPYDSAKGMFECRLTGLSELIDVPLENLYIARDILGDIPGDIPGDES